MKHPYGDYSVVGVKKERRTAAENFQLFGGLREEEGGKTSESLPLTSERTEDASQEALPTKASTTTKDDSVKEKEEEEEVPKKPPMDLFKSIFMDSSDSEEEEEEEKSDKEEEKKAPDAKSSDSGKASLFGTELDKDDGKGAKKPWEEEKKNLLRNTNPAK